MSIIRVQKNSNYSVISNVHINDERLSWKATAILTYLLSKPDNWTIYVKQLAKAKRDGIKAVYSGIRELKELGYIEHVFIHGENGKIQHGEYIVHEEPIEVEKPVNREPEPYTQKGDTVKDDTVKGTLLNTDNKQILKENNDDVPATQEKDPSSSLIALIPKEHQKQSIKKTIERALSTHTEDYVRLAILYTLSNSNGGTTAKFKAYLGKTLDNGYHDGWEPENHGTQADIEAVQEQFKKMRSENLKFLADAGNKFAQAEMDRRK